ncbi:MAG: pyridoxamine 5'-phosphate oxidase [Phycisphaerales bacterium]|nr:pyridoxamine 5'-phosphate oxidase [Phycisphaerales bacterium]
MSTLDFDNQATDPVELLHTWLEDAKVRTNLPNPNAMTLATVDQDGRPSARIVLLRGLDERGAVFFTNYASRKGRALDAHRNAALVIHWDELERQVRIEGRVSRVSGEESDAYWSTRARESRIGAWASRQSEILEDKAALEAEIERYTREFEGGEVPRPEHWGGYRVSLDQVEFWEGQPARIHDRLVCQRVNDRWETCRLSP